MPNKPPMLSKSRFLAGLQCPLRLWHQIYNPQLAAEFSPAQQAIFDMGHDVGRAATRLYPQGILIEEDYLHHPQAVESTRKAMEGMFAPAVFEAAFVHNGIRVRVDILERSDWGKWKLIEVKSSTSVKEVHLPDVAVQYHVLRGAGVRVEKAGILHPNNQYVYDGKDLNLGRLFLGRITFFLRMERWNTGSTYARRTRIRGRSLPGPCWKPWRRRVPSLFTPAMKRKPSAAWPGRYPSTGKDSSPSLTASRTCMP